MRTAHDATPPPVAVEYAREVRNRLGPHVRQIILFGSQARGDATVRSDYDFVVVLDTRTCELRDLVSDAGAMMLDRSDELCAALVYDGRQWENVLGSPLGWNIEREGILL
jgi:predicted nucleotidyltransferase